ncbi:acyl-CoA dehydrogenase family protein [Nocardia sp. CA-120079]|uniref:acyl-CoA dehydrogenase family protein n=1 Tax=Nocardia sp. CA-120079 TaxID=3239974 RepID=UPI003D967812
MDLELGSDTAEFRAALRNWIAAQAPDALAGLTDWNAYVTPGGYGRRELAAAAEHPAYLEWESELRAQRLICPNWPEEFGGRGMDARRIAVLDEEFHRAGVPRVWRGMGESLVGPAIMAHGTAEQKALFLPRIVSGEDVYLQGYSEPDHGSDLAGIETRGVVDGDEIVITGHKVWTPESGEANRMFVLCRTDPDAEKCEGLSFVLIDLADPGVRYCAVEQMTGVTEYRDYILDGVRAPLSNVIGGLNNGWRVVATPRGHERDTPATAAHLGFEREFWELVEASRKEGNIADPLVRQQLAWAYTRVQLIRFTELRMLNQELEGDALSREALVARLFASEYHKRLGEIAIGVEGVHAMLRPDGDGYPISPWQNTFLASRADTINAGTSEIQRTIIGEQALGLPREPGPAR